MLAFLAVACGGPDLDQPPSRGVAAASSNPWPQWRGPGGLGVSFDAPLPTSWSATSDNVRWRIPLQGKGNSSPIVAGGKVILTAIQRDRGEQLDRLVEAFDVSSGDPLFSTAVFSGEDYNTHIRNAAPTPVADGEHIYAFFGSHLAAVDLEGKLFWVREVDPLYAQFSHYGAASSPVRFEDLVIVFLDAEERTSGKSGWLAAFRAEDGEEVWRQEWSDTCCSYTTPVLWRRKEDVDLVVSHSGRVQAYDPATGEPRWSYKYDVNQAVASPVVEGDLLCALGGAHHVKGGGCFRVTGRGAEAVVEQLWWTQRSMPEDASPVLYDGRLYSVTVRGVMSSYDPLTGEVLWRERLPARKQHSSLVAGDGKVYTYSSWGGTVVVDARADEFALLANNALAERGGNASPALADGCIVIRTLDELFRICGEPSSPIAPAQKEEEEEDADEIDEEGSSSRRLPSTS